MNLTKRTLFKLIGTASLAITCAAAAIPQSSIAADIPDLKGTWEGKYVGVHHNKMDKPDRATHLDDVKSGWGEVALTLTIEQQDGFRLKGKYSTPNKTEGWSAVIDYDNTSIYVATDMGLCVFKLVSPDRMQGVYLHLTNLNSAAGRVEYTRKR